MAILLIFLAIHLCQAGQTALQCPVNCQTCYWQRTCHSCKPGYYKRTFTNYNYQHNYHEECVQCMAGCRICSSWELCHSCENGYVLSDKRCQPCSENCASCYLPGTCDRCNAGYYVISNQDCYHCPDRCSKCSDWTNCQSCIHGYYLQDSNCIKCPETCYMCSSQNRCSSCQTGFYLDNNMCTNCIEGCASCENYYKCRQCLVGYFLSSFGRCEACRSGCVSCTALDKCGNCSNGYYFSNNYCYACPIHCKTCAHNGYCYTCKAGFYGDTCNYKCPEGCLDKECNQNDGLCNRGCVVGFYGRVCNRSCPEGCRGKECSKQSGLCVKGCLGGYYSKTCQRCSEWCLNRECVESDGRCTQGCVDGYYEYERRCEMCSDKCKTCSSWSTCTSCNEGFYKQNCRISCPHCKPGGCYFQNGTCTNGCKDGYYQSTNMCLHCPEKCSKCNSNTYCEECQSGYFGTTCAQQCPYNCLACDDNINCKTCRAGYFGQSCNKNCSKICNECKKESELCKDCIDGYFKKGDTCLPCPDGCLRCYANKTCSSCKIGHYLSSKSSSCPACGQGCMNCSSPDACLRCFSGQANLNGICVSCNNCINITECSIKTVCSQCQDGHWGTYCTNKCGPTCILCNKDTGECMNCTRHTFGRFCELSCSSNCHKTSVAVSSCLRENGTCLYGCVSAFKGHNCTDEIPTSQQRTMVPAIMFSALGAVLIVAAAVGLLLLLRSKRNKVTQSPVCVDSNPQHVRPSIRNPTYDASIINNSARSEVKPDSNDHVYAVVQKVQLKQNPARIDKSEADDNVYDVTSTERPPAKAQRHTRSGAAKTGDDTYSHISHVNKMGRFVNKHQMDCETVYDHVPHDVGLPCNEGTYNVAGSIQSQSFGRRTERMRTNSTNLVDGRQDEDGTYSHTNQRFVSSNTDHATYNTTCDVMLPQSMKDYQAD